MIRATVAKLGMAALGAAMLAASLGLNAGPPAKKIRVIYTNDTMGYIEPCG